ncbi:MAG: hypothetical protein U0359_31140 [Byssovorax sp.]
MPSIRAAASLASLALLLGAPQARAQGLPASPPPLQPPLSQPPALAPWTSPAPVVLLLPPGVIAPSILPYDEGEPIPAGYTLKTRAHRALLLGGSITFGTTYLLSILSGAAAAANGEGSSITPLFVPVAGPFIAAGTVSTDDLGRFWLALDGITQAAGAGMLIAGLLVDQKYLQRVPVPTSLPSPPPRPEISLGPGRAQLTFQF